MKEDKRNIEFKPSLIPLHTPEKEYNKQTVKKGSHLIREFNKYDNPNKNKGQLSIFENLSRRTKDKIISSGVTVEHINKRGEAIPFSKGHRKLIDCMTELLSELSSSRDYEGNGNTTNQLIPYGNKQVKAPTLVLTLYEIAKKYNANKNPSGRHIKIVDSLLNDLAENPEYRVLIKYIRVSKNQKGDTIEDSIEEFSPLLRIATAKQAITHKATGKTSKKSEITIMLHPLFNDQINTVWVEYPSNLIERMIEANGGANIAESTYILRDFLAEKRSLKNYNIQVGLSKLLYRVAPNYINQNRKALAKKALNKAIESCIKLGLLKSYKVAKAKSGEDKYIFEINKDWD